MSVNGDLQKEALNLVSILYCMLEPLLTHCALIAEQRREKEDARRKSAERAEQRRKNKAAAEQKVAQRERARSENEERCKFYSCFILPCTLFIIVLTVSDTNRIPSRDPSTITGRDPVVCADSYWKKYCL
jgi:hypothetical protein